MQSNWMMVRMPLPLPCSHSQIKERLMGLDMPPPKCLFFRDIEHYRPLLCIVFLNTSPLLVASPKFPLQITFERLRGTQCHRRFPLQRLLLFVPVVYSVPHLSSHPKLRHMRAPKTRRFQVPLISYKIQARVIQAVLLVLFLPRSYIQNPLTPWTLLTIHSPVES